VEGKGTSRSPQAMTTVTRPMDGWNTLPWSRLQRHVFKLQKRIYQATRRDDVCTVRRLQRLLMHSWSAKLLAVRRVTQDNRGKRTAGVGLDQGIGHPRRSFPQDKSALKPMKQGA
jgi:RNA-directed DNA polymerase